MDFLYVLLAICIFGLLILIHEAGHFFFARLFRVTVNEFAIGMGPKVISHTSKKSGIVYSLRLLPFGGFVSMAGEDEESDDPNAFHRKPVWQRFLITAAGATVNLVAGILVMSILVATSRALPSTTIHSFDENSTSVQYLQPMDTVTAVDGTRVYTFNDLLYEIMRKGVEPIDITVKRDGAEITLADVVFPTVTESGAVFGSVDFIPYAEEKTPLNVLKHASVRSASTIKMIWESLYDLIGGRYGMEAVSGPVGVTQAMSEAASAGVANMVYLAVVISMNLGVMNLLPLPALDGGRLVFLLIEGIRRKPISRNVEGYIHFAGLAILMLFMVIVTFKDIIGLVR